MPAPMTGAVSVPGRRTRRNRCSPSSSASNTSTDLTANSWLCDLIPYLPRALRPLLDGSLPQARATCDRRRWLATGGTHGAGDVPGVADLQEPGDRARLPVAHPPIVHPDDREDLGGRRGEEHLACPAEACERDRRLADREAAPSREREHDGTRYAREDARREGRCDEGVTLADEHVRARRLGYIARAVHVEGLRRAAPGRDRASEDGAGVADQLEPAPGRGGVTRKGEHDDAHAGTLAGSQVGGQGTHREQ